jgi:hypothetical protein
MSPQETFTAGPLTFVVKHELWDENIQDHADQGVAIMVKAEVAGRDTTLLRFNCFDIEKSYDYGPESNELAVAGPETLGDAMLQRVQYPAEIEPVVQFIEDTPVDIIDKTLESCAAAGRPRRC